MLERGFFLGICEEVFYNSQNPYLEAYFEIYCLHFLLLISDCCALTAHSSLVTAHSLLLTPLILLVLHF